MDHKMLESSSTILNDTLKVKPLSVKLSVMLKSKKINTYYAMGR